MSRDIFGNKRLYIAIRNLYISLTTIGFDPVKLINLRNIPRYISNLREFKRIGGQVTNLYPIISDFNEQAGSARGHYFHQDLLVASFVNRANPERHIDIGSRIDGFVAHVASFRRIDVMDVRKLDNAGHENIAFFQADLTDPNSAHENITDSISCLHAIEHFGLGRYGDPLDPNGHIKGFNNILRMLKENGMLYISFPISNQNEVHFNGLRLFKVDDIFGWVKSDYKLDLLRFDYVDDNGNLHRDVNIKTEVIDVENGCGIYTFRKVSSAH